MLSKSEGKEAGQVESVIKNDQMELEMLRDFYHAWVQLHLMSREEWNMEKMREAAVTLTERAHVVAKYHKSIKD